MAFFLLEYSEQKKDELAQEAAANLERMKALRP